MPRVRPLLILLLPSALFAAPAPWSQLSAVKPGSRMIVTARPSRTIAGKLLTVSDSAIALDTTSGSAEVPRADVLRVTQRRRKSLKRSILIGVGIGAGAGAIVGSTARCGPKDFICFGRAFAVPVLAAGGAITGAIYGTVLGLSLHKQVELYAAP